MNFQNGKLYFKEYCSCSSLHGVRYISENNRSTFERIWWILTFSTSLIICMFIINATYQKWDENAIIVTQATKRSSVLEIPFPAVTICPQSKIRRSELDSLETANLSLDASYLYMICPLLGWSRPIELYVLGLSKFNDSDELFSFYDRVKPNYRSLASIRFDDHYRNMVPVVTSEGICYSFNLLDRSNIYKDQVQHYNDFFVAPSKNDWSLERGYIKKSDFDFPYRSSSLPDALGFYGEMLGSDDNVDYICRQSTGFAVWLHTPDSVPHFDRNHFKLSFNQTAKVIVKPHLTIASDSIKKYDIDRRQCYFESEKSLKYFKKYTLDNCELECLTNYTLTACGCVDFYMPREHGTNVCGHLNHLCQFSAKNMFNKDRVFKNTEESKRQPKNRRTGEKVKFQRCGCLPPCSELKYKTEFSQTHTDFGSLFSKMYMKFGRKHFNISDEKAHISNLNVYFEQNEFVSFERRELYGSTDFLANFGGLLSLFCGFSIVSFIEILYFLMVRPVCNKILFGQWISKY